MRKQCNAVFLAGVWLQEFGGDSNTEIHINGGGKALWSERVNGCGKEQERISSSER